MKYGKTNINGDAGEYFLAYKFTKILGWPCRLYGQDLGVDAEIEVLDDDSISNGDIIKIQIKAVDSIKSTSSVSVYVDDRHIEYWKKFCLPVIVCCIDLSTEKIYWKQVTATEAYDTQGESKKVSFCLEHNIFDDSSKEAFRKLVSPEKANSIEGLFVKAKELTLQLPQNTSNFYDHETINQVEDVCNNITTIVSEIDEILRSFPWKISAFALRELNWMRDMVRVTKIDISRSICDLANGG
ncbi:DUF4365 domain-containing protein [Marinomonas primoryensis]|jgi:hypothetical protein|uniref:DUF4365 domain-containing protein n=1 Tax=Marinomonas primoryensis TaxID=178399 RepID=A0A859CWY0_9GAMM|nr:DUF4365 domain-containing protein [Marinomonas primoryensis]QKK81054.1 uncharacterized protein MP3633_2327 [Marinomonas primoryensis]